MSPNKKPGAPLSSAQLKGGADPPLKDADGPRGSLGGGANSENSMFNKHYNKELKLCEGKCLLFDQYLSVDEIPMVLCELNESALAYLQREQFDNALLLL